MTMSEAESTALRRANDSILISKIPNRNEKGVFGDIEPGLTVYRKLEGLGFVFLTEEDSIELENGETFEFTPTYEITDEGRKLLEK